MAAFNFESRFVDKVESGEKVCTTRKTMRCKIGDKLTFYTGQRTKNCRKIGEAVCIGIAEVKIGFTDEDKFIPWVFIGRIGDVLPSIAERGLQKPLHERLGFMNVNEMVGFYKSHYGLPFTGYLHVWQKQAAIQEGE